MNTETILKLFGTIRKRKEDDNVIKYELLPNKDSKTVRIIKIEEFKYSGGFMVDRSLLSYHKGLIKELFNLLVDESKMSLSFKLKYWFYKLIL